MSYANFVPSVWNEGINRELERLCVFAEDCNRQYEGSVKKKGESVTILGVGKPTIRRIAKAARNNDIEAPEEIEDTSVIMYINQIAYFNYMVGDIDKAQCRPVGAQKNSGDYLAVFAVVFLCRCGFVLSAGSVGQAVEPIFHVVF